MNSKKMVFTRAVVDSLVLGLIRLVHSNSVLYTKYQKFREILNFKYWCLMKVEYFLKYST